MDKMVTRGRLSIHLQKASQLSKEWGEGQRNGNRGQKMDRRRWTKIFTKDRY
jgi:hypothetical protein